ncbi:MAG: polyphosphate kinase 2 family protein [Chloroflexi bacterium]|nr:polyphosphate kinase 2 family protein [Chloroflexota bacterium]
MKTEWYLVKPGKKMSLADYDANDNGKLEKDETNEKLLKLKQELNLLQTQLYADRCYALLIILQGMDTSGKDGVCKQVVSAFNPQGVQITSFKVPTAIEMAHDFTWRVHRVVPPHGMVGIFNRSHYEDVLVQRVENIVPKEVWSKRYRTINDFEKMLTDNRVILCKFYLHIDQEEQRLRLQDRLEDPTEHWKFNISDLKARAKWDEYRKAYEAALMRCSTDEAPWYVIPANRKWFRNYLIASILKERLQALDLRWPPLEDGTVGITIE